MGRAFSSFKIYERAFVDTYTHAVLNFSFGKPVAIHYGKTLCINLLSLRPSTTFVPTGRAGVPCTVVTLGPFVR